MFTGIAQSQIYVLDQDQARAFYVDTLGLEVAADVDLGFMRWLTVSVPGHPERQILLEKPGPPALSEETAAQVRALVTKGAMGGWLVLTTQDCHRTHRTLLQRGVEFTEEPTERPYGIDCGLRDPFGNRIRFTQPTG
ncbi:VOC family protein [Streptomyces bohaiensis]|uniref:VOC family protein n=1 Tax=Streptomyces bohaiensis TaxID=1431344 RepID=A0ABX1C5C7_9ACTN|nr:VOC family protein [Streptomyces bohaiensis]NJQ14108.1 VOC family protein [Streptomyces bohaiensis]